MKCKSISPFGQGALLISWEEADELALIKYIQALYYEVKGAGWKGILDVVPAYDTMTIFFQPDMISYGSVRDLVELKMQQESDIRILNENKHWDIPVYYHDEGMPDMQAVMQRTGLDYKSVVDFHTKPTYFVAFMGFLPGFPYLFGLPESLFMPRKQVPDRLVTAGSVAIGGKQAGIYPCDSPGGWYVLGNTHISLFDETKPPFGLLSPGDTVRFVAVN